VAGRRPAAAAGKAAPPRRPALRAPLPAAAAGQLEGRTRGITTWLRDVRSEMRKVVWPSRDEAIKLTTMVIVISIVVGVILGGFDALFAFTMTWLLQ
jgi:preprotein translocase subunit SecE